MSNLNKVASVCASVYLSKIAATPLKVIQDGDAMVGTLTDYAKSVNQLGKGKGMEDWMKVLLGVGGGKLLLDSQRNKGGWR
jgi:hypothetical protein